MKKLSLSQRLSRLQVRLHDPEWRRYGTLLLAGKMVGVALLLLGIVALFPDLMGFGKVLAADTEVKGNDIINPLNTVWTLVAAFLVFGMQVGFTMLEAGFCRSRETVNVLILFGQTQNRDQDGIVKTLERVFLQIHIRYIPGFLVIEREEPLVKMKFWRQDGFIA